MKNEQILENILQSEELIINNKLNNIRFDKTEICNIISQDENDKNCYWVSNNNIKFQAYSNSDIDYSIGSAVYVLIPQGNYELRKIILGRYEERRKEDVISLTNPFDTMVIRNNINFDLENFQIQADNIIEDEVVVDKTVSFVRSGFGDFDFFGIQFSATTSFGGTTGTFCLQPQFYKNIGTIETPIYQSLLTLEQQNAMTFNSKLIQGNPYYLNENIKIQYLFNFPLNIDIEQIAKIEVKLFTDGKFEFEKEENKYIVIKSLNFYFGYDINNETLQKNKIVLTKNGQNNFEYTTEEDYKLLYIDWYDSETQIIYNRDLNFSFINNYYIFWLEFFEPVGYKKEINGDIINLLRKCYYKNNIELYTQSEFIENIDFYFQDSEQKELYKSYYRNNKNDFENNLQIVFYKQDISESGACWRTVQNLDAEYSQSYFFTLIPHINWPREKMKVIIKNIEDNSYVESNILNFDNTRYKIEPKDEKNIINTINFTINNNDNNFNFYGLDNKSLKNNIYSSYTITANIINGEWLDSTLQDITWKIPKLYSMLDIPKKYDNNTHKYINDSDWQNDINNLQYYLNITNNQTVSFGVSNQYLKNRTNNIISCEIIQYVDSSKKIISNKYYGEIKLNFSSFGKYEPTYNFNIYPDTPDGILLSNNINNSIKFTAKLLNKYGEEINLQEYEQDIKWYLLGNENSVLGTGKTFTITKNKIQNSSFAILIAKLINWEIDDTTATIDLISYYSIPRTLNYGYYITGCNKIIYDYSGNNPNYDITPYKLCSYNDTNNISSSLEWKIEEDNSRKENSPSLITNNKNEIILQPLGTLSSKLFLYSIIVKDLNNQNQTVYVQPLIILQDTYAFSYLNTWDGSTHINEKEGTIMSQLIGAGSKNTSNEYTGVLIGITDKTGTGIYGLQNGALRYKLDEKGSFYVGNGDSNYISFNDSGRGTQNQLVIKTNKFVLNGINLNITSEATEDTDKLINYNDIFSIQKNSDGQLGNWFFHSFIENPNEYQDDGNYNRDYKGLQLRFNSTNEIDQFGVGAALKKQLIIDTINKENVLKIYQNKSTSSNFIYLNDFFGKYFIKQKDNNWVKIENIPGYIGYNWIYLNTYTELKDVYFILKNNNFEYTILEDGKIMMPKNSLFLSSFSEVGWLVRLDNTRNGYIYAVPEEGNFWPWATCEDFLKSDLIYNTPTDSAAGYDYFMRNLSSYFESLTITVNEITMLERREFRDRFWYKFKFNNEDYWFCLNIPGKWMEYSQYNIGIKNKEVVFNIAAAALEENSPYIEFTSEIREPPNGRVIENSKKQVKIYIENNGNYDDLVVDSNQYGKIYLLKTHVR